MPFKDPAARAAYHQEHAEVARERAGKWYAANGSIARARNAMYYAAHRERALQCNAKWRASNPEAVLLARAKHRARSQGLDFDLSRADIVIPTVCPVLGITLVFGSKEFAPSIDRIDNALGYVRGNVIVVSLARQSTQKQFIASGAHANRNLLLGPSHMTMSVIISCPPNYEELDRVFGVRARHGVLFCWGSLIYNPDGIRITPYLMAHEGVHGDQHRAIPPETWWRRFIDDAEFRLAQELPAHVMEYRAYCRRHTDQGARVRMLRQIAQRLAGPLYGRVLNEARAHRAILEARLP